MKLLFRRDQRSGLMNKVIFTLAVRADLSPEEREAVRKYKFGSSLLYAREQLRVEEETWKGVAKFWLKHALNLTISVDDLTDGKVIECKTIGEMLAAEEQVKDAAANFAALLRAAMYFGGEEVVEV